MTPPLPSTPHSQLSASQTAPVAEFRCLYTPDIRKKQKKWQDGYLKFHTFNNRVMVYDQARNFLGDTYYKDSNELHEGDELTLDKGVMVEVADAMGVTQTDLTPLFEKKPKEAPQPPTAPPRRFQPPSQVARPHTNTPSNAARTNAQLRHKSLNTLLGTPKGPIGKAVPIKSPYEARQEKEKENDFAIDRAAKRQKTTHRSTSSATLRLSSPAQEKTLALKETKTSDAKTVPRPAKTIPEGAHIITLDDFDAIAHISSDISVPSTPPLVTSAPAQTAITLAPPIRPLAKEKLVPQTPRIPKGKVPVPSVKAAETPRVAAPPSSPPVSASNRLSNVDFAIQPTPVKGPIQRSKKLPLPPPLVYVSQSPPRQPKAKSLRLSAGVKRGTLMMCQPPAAPRPTLASETVAASRASRRLKSASPPITAEIATTHTSAAGLSIPKARRTVATKAADSRDRSKAMASHEVSMNVLDDDQEVVHGLMDQQLLVSPVLPGIPPLEPILVPSSPEPIVAQSGTTKQSQRQTRKPPSPKTKESKVGEVSPPPARVCKDAQLKKSVRNISPPAALVIQPPHLQSRAASPPLSAVSDSRSRTASMSPRKLAALSTGGFRKKLRRTTPQTTPMPEDPSIIAQHKTVALPPHPLRANKKGPFMTTTELAATLQKPKRKTKTNLDPIEDDITTAGRSPDRKFRRVRSENDAPIPSTSDDWEKRNLPKHTPTTSDASIIGSTKATEPPAVAARNKSGLAALVKKTDPRRKLARTQSLNIDTNILPNTTDMESPIASPVVDKDIGPWSTEAFDLFDWRPPRTKAVDS